MRCEAINERRACPKVPGDDHPMGMSGRGRHVSPDVLDAKALDRCWSIAIRFGHLPKTAAVNIETESKRTSSDYKVWVK